MLGRFFSLSSVLRLPCLAFVAALLLAGLYHLTQNQISINQALATQRILDAVFPANEQGEPQYNNDLMSTAIEIDNPLGGGKKTKVYRAYLDDKAVGVIFNLETHQGYNGKMGLLIGIRANGQVAAVRVHQHQETPGLGDAIEIERSDWILSFNQTSLEQPQSPKGWKVKRDGGEFDQFTGATITPRAVVTATHQTLLYFSKHSQHLLP